MATAMIDEEENNKAGTGDQWRIFTHLIRSIWETGHIPRQMLKMVIVLLPKGGGDFRGIGLENPIWKIIEVAMDDRLKALELHDCLHGFTAGRGTGTATMEAKLSQQFTFIEQMPLYEIFVDLRRHSTRWTGGYA